MVHYLRCWHILQVMPCNMASDTPKSAKNSETPAPSRTSSRKQVHNLHCDRHARAFAKRPTKHGWFIAMQVVFSPLCLTLLQTPTNQTQRGLHLLTHACNSNSTYVALTEPRACGRGKYWFGSRKGGSGVFVYVGGGVTGRRQRRGRRSSPAAGSAGCRSSPCVCGRRA